MAAEQETSVRVDAWIWSVRLTKTRALAAACRGGHVRVNGERVKAAASVRAGDEGPAARVGVRAGRGGLRLVRKRVGAPVAIECYVDNSPPRPSREEVAVVGVRDRGAGRPTKRDRRELERLYGHPGDPSAAGEQQPAPGHGTGRPAGGRRGR
ncbi:RNA-binding S4 domain-containing protein [Streptacidiphilus sp. 4-A2]|nr:RNA-binding S4 domain-containing protein [Streptacidiphilus sp. 4-A2]